MTSYIEAAVQSPRRRRFQKGLRVAEETLLNLAQSLHAKQVGTGAKSDGTRSTDVLAKLAEISAITYGETSSLADLRSTAANYHADFGEHDESARLLESVARSRSNLGDEIGVADALRRLSLSYGALDRHEDAETARTQARQILVAELQNSPALPVLEALIRDEVVTADQFASPGEVVLAKNVCDPRRGEVYWVQFPQFPNDPHQPRPAVIVSQDRHNLKSSSVTVAPLFSKYGGHRYNLPLPRSEGALEGGCVHCNKVTAIDKSLVRGNAIATLPQEFVDDVLRLSFQALKETTVA